MMTNPRTVLDNGYVKNIDFWGSDERVIRQYANAVHGMLAYKFPRTLKLFADVTWRRALFAATRRMTTSKATAVALGGRWIVAMAVFAWLSLLSRCRQ